MDSRKYLAEGIGTALLVIFGCGTASIVGCDPANGSGYLITALAFGLVLMALAYSIGKISGCHVNPAVSLAMWIDKKLSTVDLIGYILSQIIGGLVGALILSGIVGIESGMGANNLASGGVLVSLLIEIILTFVFVLAIFGATEKKEESNVSGIVIGLSLTLVHLLGIGFTGTSVNPARSIGPALLVGGDPLKYLWIFILGPVIGAVIAAFVWKILRGKKIEKIKEQVETAVEEKPEIQPEAV